MSSGIAAEVVPSSADRSFVLALAPRVGAWLPLSRRWSFWPRAGVTWVSASTSSKYGGSYPNHHLGIDVDAFAVFSPVQGIGITAGPSLALPIAGSTEIYTPSSRDSFAPLNRTTADSSVLSIGLSAGLVLLL